MREKALARRRIGGIEGAAFAIKVCISNPQPGPMAFTAQKTMYGGKLIAQGDAIFLFASENESGPGLVGRGIVNFAADGARQPGIARQTPRVTLGVTCTALAKRLLGRQHLRHFTNWQDGQPGTELNFKLYRQATNKVIGISAAARAFLDDFF